MYIRDKDMEKNKKHHFIYKTTSKFNSKFYIGIHSTDNLNDGYMGSGSKLLSDIKKYGKDQYEIDILEFCESKEELKKREKEILTEDILNNWYCLNIVSGGNDYKKGDKVYYKTFNQKKWSETKFCQVIKENEKRHILTNLLPYYKTIGWEEIT